MAIHGREAGRVSGASRRGVATLGQRRPCSPTPTAHHHLLSLLSIHHLLHRRHAGLAPAAPLAGHRPRPGRPPRRPPTHPSPHRRPHQPAPTAPREEAPPQETRRSQLQQPTSATATSTRTVSSESQPATHEQGPAHELHPHEQRLTQDVIQHPSEAQAQVLLAPAPQPDLLSAWSLPPSSPLSPFNPHHTAAPPTDLPVDVDSDLATPASPRMSPLDEDDKDEHGEHDDNDSAISSPIEFAPAPGDEVYGVGPPRRSEQRLRQRPPALLQQRDLHAHVRQHSIATDSTHGGISISSTIYPASRHSFFELDDPTPSPTPTPPAPDPNPDPASDPASPAPTPAPATLSPDDAYTDARSSTLSLFSNPNAMYPTPTRGAFRPLSRADTVRSTSSQLPAFNSPGAADADAPYQPALAPAPHRERQCLRPRPHSLLASPSPTAVFFDYTDAQPRGERGRPPLPTSPKPPLFLRKAAAASTPPSPTTTSATATAAAPAAPPP
ncbi:hypothetical protein JB92DRAFT_3149519, partial [Gautieria morchelliformis]